MGTRYGCPSNVPYIVYQNPLVIASLVYIKITAACAGVLAGDGGVNVDGDGGICYNTGKEFKIREMSLSLGYRVR